MDGIVMVLNGLLVLVALGAMIFAVAMLIIWPRWQLRALRQENARLQAELERHRTSAPPASVPEPPAIDLGLPLVDASRMYMYRDQMVADLTPDARFPPSVPQGIWPLLTIQMQMGRPMQPYSFALGWAINEDREPIVAYASFHSDAPNFALHPLITGKSGAGKDILAFCWMVSLCMTHGPDQVRICWISKKKTDGEFWRGKQHLWCPPAIEDHEIEHAFKKLVNELERRERTLADAQVSKWENYRGGTMPLLVVYLSELDSVAMIVGTREFDAWLSTFLSRCRAAGIRVILAPQNVNNKSTNWRGNTELQAAGFQRSSEYDKPSLGMTPDEVRKLGGLPPSELPGPGLFTVCIHRTVYVVRVPNLSDAERVEVLRYLPDGGPSGTLVPQVAPQTAPVVAPQTAPVVAPQVVAATVPVPAAPQVAVTPALDTVTVEAGARTPVAQAAATDKPAASPVVPVSEAPSQAGAAPVDDAERLVYAMFLMETGRERDRNRAIARATERLAAGDDEKLTYALFLLDTKQVDGVSRAVERAWSVKRGGGVQFQSAKARVEDAVRQRPRLLAPAAA